MKERKEVTTQVAVYQTRTQTLAIYANLRPVSMEAGEDFMTIITGKFKLDLNNFSNGKGDNAKHIQFNLDIKDVKYLHARAMMFHLPLPFSCMKNYTMPAAIIKDGPDKGKAVTKKIYITRTPKSPKGDLMRSPWMIQIENGVSRPKSNGYSSVEIEPNSYECRVKDSIRLNDVDFMDLLDKAYTYMMEYRHIVAQDIIPKGNKILDEIRERRGNSYNTVPPEEYMPETPSVTGTEQPIYDPRPVQENPVSTQTTHHPQLFKVIALIGELQGYEDYFLSECTIKENKYIIRFYNDYITPAVHEAIRLKQPKTILVYKKGEDIIFYKLAETKN